MPVDLSDIGDAIDCYDGPLFTRKPMPARNGNGKAHATVEDGTPVDVDGELAAMTHGTVNETYKRVMPAMLLQGTKLDDAVAKWVDAVMGASEREKLGWSREHELKATPPRVGTTLKFLQDQHDWGDTGEVPDWLSGDLEAKWVEIAKKGLRPRVARNANNKGWHVREYPRTGPQRVVPEIDWDALMSGKPGNGSAKGTDEKAKGGEKADGGSADKKKDQRKYRFKLTPFWEMKLGVEQPYLVEELIPMKGIVVAWGPPKCFKSFIMLDMMLHVAKGWEYRDRAVQQGTIAYLAFEGGHGFRKRCEALRIHYGTPPEDRPPLHILAGNVNLVTDHKELIKEINAQMKDFGATKPVAVVLDTLNKSLRGSESKDADMAAYIAAAEAVRDAFDCVVIIVHHCGYDETRMRGHSSLPAALDTSLAIVRNENVATMLVEYMRDGPEDIELSYRSKVIEVGQQANGKAITTLVMEWGDEDGTDACKKPERPLTEEQRLALRMLNECLAKEGEVLPPGLDVAGIRGVKVKAWAEAMAASQVLEDRPRNAWSRLKTALQARGEIKIHDPWVWVPFAS
jgi:hypothetical protein